jgi:ssDNA-binding Zn-finger/Zn-ribbon topoisomerase 1
MKCPKCEAGMRERVGRFGRFLGCSNWPRCNGSRDLESIDNLTTTKPRTRSAKLRVIFPETISQKFRRREPRPYQLKIYRHDEAEFTSGSDLACEAL